MNQYTSLLVFGALMAGSMVDGVRADDLSYSFAQVRYADQEIDNINLDGDGFVIGGSYRINDTYFAFGSYSDLGFDRGLDSSTLQAGGGYIYPLNERAHAVGKVFVARSEASRPGFKDSDTGFGLEAGVRGLIIPKLEARGFVTYSDVGGSDTSFTLGGDYYFTPQLSAGLTANFGGDAQGFTIGARFYFPE